MYTLFVILAVIVAVLLALVVLIQESKGGGLASSFASSNQIMGVRKTTDFIEKATWTLAGVLVLLSVVSTLLLSQPKQESIANDLKAAPTQPVSQGAGANATGQQAPAK